MSVCMCVCGGGGTQRAVIHECSSDVTINNYRPMTSYIKETGMVVNDSPTSNNFEAGWMLGLNIDLEDSKSFLFS